MWADGKGSRFVWLLVIRNAGGIWSIRLGITDIRGASIPGCTVDAVIIERAVVLGLVITAETTFVSMTFVSLSWST